MSCFSLIYLSAPTSSHTNDPLSAISEFILNYVIIGIDLAAAFVIVASVALALTGYVRALVVKHGESVGSGRIRFRLAGGLLLALDFQVGSDLLKIVLVPTLNDLFILSVIVVLRILLGWSLSKEVTGHSEDLLKK